MALHRATAHKEIYSIYSIVFKFHGRAIRTKKSEKDSLQEWVIKKKKKLRNLVLLGSREDNKKKKR